MAANTPNENDALLGSATIRQPATELGPRAQRTIDRIVAATREVFMTRGYAGTTIDEVARTAEVSRASFYTYFPSKKEVLLAVGADTAGESTRVIDSLVQRPKTRAAMTEFVTEYFDFLDVHGAFAFAWTQAANEDEEIRVAGMRRHLRLCKHFGEILAESSGKPSESPTLLGLTATSMLERSWHYSQLYHDKVERNSMIAEAAQALWAIARSGK